MIKAVFYQNTLESNLVKNYYVSVAMMEYLFNDIKSVISIEKFETVLVINFDDNSQLNISYDKDYQCCLEMVSIY